MYGGGGVFVHTLNTESGLLRKVDALGLSRALLSVGLSAPPLTRHTAPPLSRDSLSSQLHGGEGRGGRKGGGEGRGASEANQVKRARLLLGVLPFLTDLEKNDAATVLVRHLKSKRGAGQRHVPC